MYGVVLFFLLILAVVVILPIAALTVAVQARRRVAELKNEVTRLRRDMQPDQAQAPVPEPMPAEPAVEDAIPRETPSAIAPPIEPVAIEAPVEPRAPVAVPPIVPGAAKRSGLEVTLGVKAGAILGITAVVAGIVFFVGYAIQQNWISPGLRVLAGLAAGLGLIGGGRVVEASSDRYHVLTRVLTGGGVALCYFSVFAAYSIYDIIGSWTAFAGLCLSAAGAFLLAMTYRSQVVAVLGVVGAFLTPLLIGGDFETGVFPLVFIAVVNVPVLLLGVQRNWQYLYNIAFGFTVIYMIAWLDGPRSLAGSVTGLAYALVFYGEFAGLAFLKLRGERTRSGRHIDVIRLALTIAFLALAIYVILDDSAYEEWLGAAFLAAAALQGGLAWLARATMRDYRDEILTFILGAVSLAVFAVPLQLDGIWIAVGWAIEGVLLAAFAGGAGVPALHYAGLVVGGLAICRALLAIGDPHGDAHTVFLNRPFVIGIFSCIALLAQDGISRRFAAGGEPGADVGRRGAWIYLITVAGMTAMGWWEVTVSWGWASPATFLVVGTLFLLAGTVLALAPLREGSRWLIHPAGLFLAAVSGKILLGDLWFRAIEPSGTALAPWGMWFWLQLLLVAATIVVAVWRMDAIGPSSRWGKAVRLFALVAGVLIVTVEIYEMGGRWSQPTVTLWWSAASVLLVLIGLARRRPEYRYLALVIFGIAVVKVFFVDLGDLRGLPRIAALVGTGVLLLAVSVAYQRVTSLLSEDSPDPDRENG